MTCHHSFYFNTKPKILKAIEYPITFFKNFTNAEKRSENVLKVYAGTTLKSVKVSFKIDIHLNITLTKFFCFLKSFWFLKENAMVHRITSLLSNRVEINKQFSVQPETLKVFSESLEQSVEIPIPKSHLGPKPIRCRLISVRWRKGMVRKIKWLYCRLQNFFNS